ncbi:MAG: hypothetical protein KY475_24930, partial [Planctomycetes bacterium]|nr:hypothetical protein [Planctomycetota bacterium]
MTQSTAALLISLFCGGQLVGAGPDQPYGIDIRPDAKVQERLDQISESIWDKRLPLVERLRAVGTLEEFARDERRF